MEERITFEDIQRVNDTIKTTPIQGKDYAEVNQRIKAFRMLYPTGTIHTTMLSNENGVCIFKATAIDEKGTVLATGTAYERENSTFINKTSYIENCETSAVGRCLGFLGLGIDTSIASADEVANAINNQRVTTVEEAEKFVINFGKHKGKTIKEVIECDEYYIDWLFDNEKTDQAIKDCITLLTGREQIELTEEEQQEHIELIIKLNGLLESTKTDREKLYSHYKVKSNKDMTIEQLKDAISKLEKRK